MLQADPEYNQHVADGNTSGRGEYATGQTYAEALQPCMSAVPSTKFSTPGPGRAASAEQARA